ncbi:NADPH-dependent FMN reductase [Pseudonocardia spirodelae]|uniref:NAD(P)H-dependent oxidoreductase n=1 Tax=Pseudonocardia spirodelae TaxID=3133431 RepID=A0ABU8T2C4_9PSEU
MTVDLLALIGSPTAGGRTDAAAAAVLAGARAAGARVRTIALGERPPPEQVQAAMDAADGVLFASPTYRARSSGLIKGVLENTPRGAAGETGAPLLGTAAAIVHTGASAHHFLAVDDLRAVLAGFFAAQVLSPGLYLEAPHFDDTGALTGAARDLAAAHGRAFAEFTAAVRGAPAVVALLPLL